MNILATILITMLIVFVAVFFLSFKLLITKDGKFPNIHIGGSSALRNKGITCATSQDAEAQRDKPTIDVSRIINEIDEN